jgi:vitamin B12 transporter
VSELSFEGGSFHTFREAASTRGAVGKLDYALSASRFDAEYPRPNSEFEMTSFRGSVGYEATKDLYFDLKGSLSISKGGSPGSVSFPDPIAKLKREVSRISPGVEWKVSDTLSTKAYYSFDRQWQRSTSQFGSDDKLTVDAHQVDAQAEWQPIETLRIVPGVTMVDVSFSRFNLAGVENIRAHQTGVGGFVQGLWNPVERLNFVSAFRYDAYTDYDNAFTWRQAVAYRVPGSETRLHASVSESYSPPTAQDLYFPGFSNPNLQPEESLGYEVGVEQPFFHDHVRVSGTWFRNEIDNLIQSDAFFIPQNISKALTEGLEFGLEYQPNARFKARASYTYLTAIDDKTGLRLLRRPRHQVGVNSTYTPVEKLTLSAGVTWVIERQDSQFPGQIPIGDYLTVRGAISYRINDHVEIWVRGENLTDDRYDYVNDFPALGFGAFGGVKVKF